MKKSIKILIAIVSGIVLIIASGFGVLIVMFTPKELDVNDGLIKVSCVGDSITFGMGVALNKRNENSYPAKLQALLGEEYQVLNYGYSGRTLLKSGEKPYWNDKVFEYSKEANPDIVLIMLGTNDSKDFNWNATDFEAQLEKMVNIYIDLSNNPIVYILKPCAAFVVDGKESVKFSISNVVIEGEILDIIDRVALSTGATIIDIFSATRNHPEYFGDGVHPNAEGNMVIAETIYNILELTTK